MILAGALLAAVGYCGLLLLWCFRDRGAVHTERSYLVGGVLYVGPRTLRLLRKSPDGERYLQKVIVSDLCKPKTGW